MTTQLESDCMTLALRLYSADPATFAPETAEVMDRWRPRVEALLRGEAPNDITNDPNTTKGMKND